MNGELRSSGAIQGEIDLKQNLIDDTDTGLKVALDGYKKRKQDALAIVNKPTDPLVNRPYTGTEVKVADPGMVTDKAVAQRELTDVTSLERQALADITKLQTEISRLKEELDLATAREKARTAIDPLMNDCRKGKGFEACRNELDAQRKDLGEVLFDRYLKEYERLLAEAVDAHIREFIRNSEQNPGYKITVDQSISTVSDTRLRDAVYDRREEMQKHLDQLRERYSQEAANLSDAGKRPNNPVRNEEAWKLVVADLAREAQSNQAENRKRLKEAVVVYVSGGGAVADILADPKKYITGFNFAEWDIMSSYVSALVVDLGKINTEQVKLAAITSLEGVKSYLNTNLANFAPPERARILVAAIEQYAAGAGDNLMWQRIKGWSRVVGGAFGAIGGLAGGFLGVNAVTNSGLGGIVGGAVSTIPGLVFTIREISKIQRYETRAKLDRDINVVSFRDSAISALGKEFSSDDIKSMYRLSSSELRELRGNADRQVQTSLEGLSRI